MTQIAIRRPGERDINELNLLFEITITDNFRREGIEHDIDGLKQEIHDKDCLLQEDFKSNGRERFFLVACHGGKIVGTISYGPCGEAICECSKGSLNDVGEVGTLYILPEYQKKGIGTLLLNSIFTVLMSRGIKEYCLDSGYKTAQQIWRRKFGEPVIVVKDYWAKGFDHYIWHRTLEDTPIIYKTC
jgi:GNAT superfamily N-acetyltransferase